MKDINLLPEDVKINQYNNIESSSATKKSTGITIFIAVLVLLMIAASILIPKLILIKIENDYNTLNKFLEAEQYQEVKQISAKIAVVDKTINNKNNILTAIDAKSYPVSELLNSIKRSAPKGCYVTEVKMEENKMEIGGYSVNSVLIAELMSNLDRLENYSRIGQTDSVKYDKANSSYKFKITYKLVGKEEKKK